MIVRDGGIYTLAFVLKGKREKKAFILIMIT
jgi:hypothetical protein